ncbi:hypothetical protein [Brucella intermedia]|uniref:Uncharacterized protein n=1 Tax=Brucella intermedia TaxID=94625 RepID=A0A7V6PBM5_9HYPH|nr:hypothetical protein [Brucella intermedia]WGG58801.1 hypothetical protein QA414_10750 [Brucella intermedia]HHV67768.1 hypothetical protein [Brucella intermedia]
MHALEDVIFSDGRFAGDENNVRFVEEIANTTPGQYVVLVSREYDDGADYRRLFAQVHFVAKDGDGYIAMGIPVVESFDGHTDAEDGESYSLRQELKSYVEILTSYTKFHDRRAEFDSGLPLENESWDDFRNWLSKIRRDQ